MGESQWYYLDGDRKQHGPVSPAFLRAELRSGRVPDTTLVWREGMPEWSPLARVIDELGVAPSPPDAGSVPASAAPDGPFANGQPVAPQRGDDVVPAGFLRRWAALFIDSLLLGVGLVCVSTVLAMVYFMSRTDSSTSLLQLVYYGLYLVVAPLYYAGMESSRHQATLGKRALGIKVTDDHGRRLSFGHALGRWFAASLSYLTCYVGFLMAAFTERKRALHDIVAGTLVVDRWAYTEFPERQQREASGCLIALLVCMLGIPFVAGVIAAIAIPQWQDYEIRAQVSEGMALANGAKLSVEEHRLSEGAFPRNNSAAGLPAPTSMAGTYVSRVKVGENPGEIVVSFSSMSPQKANAQIDGASLVLTPTNDQAGSQWRCHSKSIRKKWCPRDCECQ